MRLQGRREKQNPTLVLTTNYFIHLYSYWEVALPSRHLHAQLMDTFFIRQQCLLGFPVTQRLLYSGVRGPVTEAMVIFFFGHYLIASRLYNFVR